MRKLWWYLLLGALAEQHVPSDANAAAGLSTTEQVLHAQARKHFTTNMN